MKVEMLIREVRDNKEISLSQLAKTTGIAKSHLSNIERNIIEPKLTTVLKIAQALDVDIKELYKYKE